MLTPYFIFEILIPGACGILSAAGLIFIWLKGDTFPVPELKDWLKHASSTLLVCAFLSGWASSAIRYELTNGVVLLVMTACGVWTGHMLKQIKESEDEDNDI